MKNLFLILFVIAIAAACSNRGAKTQEGAEKTITANKTVDLSVEGMTCTGCENTISEAVSKIDGVAEVKASYPDSLVIVTFDSTRTSPEAFGNAISEAGYIYKGLK